MTHVSDTAALRTRREALLEALRADAARGVDGRALCAARTRGLDAILRDAFAAALARVGDPRGAELAAVGSYGRGTLAPLSDVDVRVLVPGANRGAAAELADALLYPLWDAGFAVGHQVMDPGDLGGLEADLATATSLLDLRHVAGAERARDLALRALADLSSGARLSRFLTQLREDAAQREERFGSSVYLLEPEVKLGTGGLRDLDAALWAMKARLGRPAELREMGALLADHEIAALEAAEELLVRVRNRLHLGANRRSDRLSFDAQESIAVAMGYARGDLESHATRAEAAERLMQDYYRAARVIAAVRERVTEPPRPKARRREVGLGRGLVVIDGHVALASGALDDDPPVALRLYQECARSNRPPWPEARTEIARACAREPFAERLRAAPEAAEAFVALVCTVGDAPVRNGSMAQELHDVGLLLAMVPEFLPVTGRVHHDVYHVLTVDAHSVAAVDLLRALVRGELAKEHPIATHLAAEIARPEPLFVATLLHDFGKGFPDASGSRTNHSKRGAELCDAVLPRLGFDAEDTADARALVEHHLAMYHVASRRDLDDPSTAQELAKVLTGRDGLRDLYLLTIADISTTSPAAMTSWKAKMLEELYLRVDAFLAGHETAHDERRRAESRARVLAKAPPLERASVAAFVDAMPARYLTSTPAPSVVTHARVAAARGVASCAVEIAAEHEGAVEVVVVADDVPGLLAKISAALVANRLEVLSARIHSRSRALRYEAIDVFVVRPRGEAAPERLVVGVREDLDRLIRGEIDAPNLLALRLGQTSPWRERPSPPIEPEVVLDEWTSPTHTIVEVVAKDRPGLLHRLAQALHDLHLSIAVSKITTEGAKAIDVFYVSEEDGSKVESKERLAAIRDRLLEAVGT